MLQGEQQQGWRQQGPLLHGSKSSGSSHAVSCTVRDCQQQRMHPALAVLQNSSHNHAPVPVPLSVPVQRATCGNMRPVTKAGVLYTCPEFTEFDPARTLVYPPRPESCCRAATCDNIKPISKAGVKFVCPADREYDPTKSNNTSPTINSCCSQVGGARCCRQLLWQDGWALWVTSQQHVQEQGRGQSVGHLFL